mgnify:CR=1 FL=1
MDTKRLPNYACSKKHPWGEQASGCASGVPSRMRHGWGNSLAFPFSYDWRAALLGYNRSTGLCFSACTIAELDRWPDLYAAAFGAAPAI